MAEPHNFPKPAKTASAAPTNRPLGLLASVGLLYVSFGIIFGILQGGLPPILRAQGVDVGSLGWFVAVLLPFGLTFLWAPLVDRIAIHRRAPRVAWIAVMQTIVAAILLSIAYSGSDSIQVVFVLTLAIAFAAATMDVALDALASSTFTPADRAFASGIKVGSLALGAILGGGLFVVYFHRVGWTNIFLTVTAFTLLATLPILTQVRWDKPANPGSDSKKPNLLETLRKPDHQKRLLILSLVSVPVVMFFGLNRIMLVDAGLTLAQIGSIAGTLSPVGSLLAAALGVVLMRRFGAVASIFTFTAIFLVAAGLIIAGFHFQGYSVPTMAGAVIATAASSGFYVVICTIVFGWANTAQPATDYAALYGISRLLGMVVLMLAAKTIVPTLGWAAFYAVATVLLIAVIPLTVGSLRRFGDLRREAHE